MALDGSNLSPSSYGSFELLNEIKNNWSSASAPSDPAVGVMWYDTVNQVLKIYNGSGWQEAANTLGTAPMGSIVGWCPGYFADGSNGGFVAGLGTVNTVASQNSFLNPFGWYVCDGAAPNEPTSTIWNAADRYLPDLTDSRFLQGDTGVLDEAVTVGANTMAHTHACDPPATTSGGPSSATKVAYLTPSWQAATAGHTHSLDIASFASDVASNAENRPVFLGLFFIARVF